jgi:spore germination protein YaaH
MQQDEIVSPLPDKPLTMQFSKPDSKSFYVLGFLPHWNLDKWQVNTKVFDEIVFFTYDVDNLGNIEDNHIGPKVNTDKFKKIRGELEEENKTLSFSVRLFQDEDIDLLVQNTQSHKNFVRNIENKLADGIFNGVNIDFEYTNSPTAILSNNFVQLLQTLKKETDAKISVDLYSNTIIHGNTEMLRKLSEAVDHIVIMAYDFHRPGSTYTGPVAPLRTRNHDKNIINTLKIANQKFPREKLIMAFPLYGYEWYTANEEFASQTLDMPTALASYGRMKDFLKKDKEHKVFWDRIGQSPWLVYKQGNYTKQIYFENLRSIKIKLDLIKQSSIAGIGFWSLGYEGNNNEIWEEVNNKLR